MIQLFVFLFLDLLFLSSKNYIDLIHLSRFLTYKYLILINIFLSQWQHIKIKPFNIIYPEKVYAAAAAKALQSCPTLCDPRDGSPPGFLVPGILQARTLEWVAISFSNAWKWKMKVKSLSRVRLYATP